MIVALSLRRLLPSFRPEPFHHLDLSNVVGVVLCDAKDELSEGPLASSAWLAGELRRSN
jgi:hypothetical protein